MQMPQFLAQDHGQNPGSCGAVRTWVIARKTGKGWLMETPVLTRRQTVSRWLAGVSLGVAGPALWLAPAGAALLPQTPSCGAGGGLTIAQTEGPFYKPGTPQKRDFRPDAPGQTITLIGFVIDRRCKPVSGAIVDLWHADSKGAYDNGGFKLRGYQTTDAQGRYVFETIAPGVYPGRTRHFHVKVAAPGQRALTTQLYFPDDAAANKADFIFDSRLLMRVEAAADGRIGRYDFVVAGG